MDRETLCEALKRAVRENNAPGAVAYVGRGDETLLFEAVGYRSLKPTREAAKKETIYDLASLTKVLATTTAILMLRDVGALELDQSAGSIVHIPAFDALTVRHLLTHTAGLVAVKPYYQDCSSLDEMLLRYATLGLSWPPGSRWRYSDVGFMILGKIVELTARDSLDAFCQKRIFGPLQMKHTAFKPPADWISRCAPTEQCPWRKKLIHGEVHDENAYAVGGVAGHAGLFSTAEDLARFARALLAGSVLQESTVGEMIRLGQAACFPWQGLGWRLDPWSTDHHGFLPSRQAFGHSGWTGTSLWMDRNTGLFSILLSNTCHPTRDRRHNGELRRVFCTRVARECYTQTANVHTGLDRLLLEGFEPLRGKRVALLTNQAAVDQLGRHILDVFKLCGNVEVRRLYSPEHGLWGQAEAGAEVKSQTGIIPTISLYGDRTRPTTEELEDIDQFVVDLQDVGARYYTFLATLKECMTACADAGKPMLILDRPNPLGGEILEGPIASRSDVAVCCAPIPVRHGMTFGELALFLQKTFLAKRRLQVGVTTLDNWERRHFFHQCALPWVPPSPNMPTPETALLYAGTCLFEGTNLNEGRGTDSPFALLGAPWLDSDAVLKRIDEEERVGCTLEPVTYTPRAMPGKATHPTYLDRECQGIRVRVQDSSAVRALTLTLALLAAIHRVHPRKIEWKKNFDVLAGSPELRIAIEHELSPRDIVAAWAPALKEFDKTRPRRY
ncbi:MAG: DUF1343 domain-containing protein [Candidatus Hydrogenedentes bacterium]|nr:DUF1343 domain-containing protein [Candidatus Hydrogenedentota bacterium]